MNPRPDDHPILCGCKTPTINGDLTCENCLNQLSITLGELPWLDEQLEVAVSRQRGASFAGGGGHSSGETPLPWNEAASRSARRLQHTLATWVRRCHTEAVAHQSPNGNLPRPTDDPTAWTITDMSRWLAWRVDGLAHHRIGHRATHDITSAAAAATQTVLWTKRDRIFLGPCDNQRICGGEVWATDGADAGTCDACNTSYPVEERRRELEAELANRLCSASEIAGFAKILGSEWTSEQIRMRINSWHHRKVITAIIRDPHSGKPLFRFSEVRTLLAEAEAKRQRGVS